METEGTALSMADGCPKYLALAKGFERQLRNGVLRVGDRLPSVRQLRQTHRISVATAVGCYLWLEQRGYVRARPKSGFYVARTAVTDSPAPDPATRIQGPVPVRLGSLATQSRTAAGVLDLGPAVVSAALLPMNRLNQSIRIALSAFGDHAVRYEDRRGNLRLRRQIARLAFRQGVTCVPDDIVVTSGATEALNLAIRAVAKPGDVVAVESPGCFDVLEALEALRMRAVEVPHVPNVGVHRELLAAAAKKHRLKALVVNATCHNPIGDCVPDAHKAALVTFAAASDIAILEMDTFGDLVFSGQRPKALKAFDRAGIVMQCASLAHYVAPGFNIGWANPARWRDEFARLKGITNVAGAGLPQLALAEFLESGGFEKHLKRLRVALWRSVEGAREEILMRFPPGTRVSRPDGGFVLWIQLPAGYDGEDVQRRAAAAGIDILPGAAFSPSGQFRSFIRIACGHPLETLQPAIRTIAGLL